MKLILCPIYIYLCYSSVLLKIHLEQKIVSMASGRLCDVMGIACSVQDKSHDDEPHHHHQVCHTLGEHCMKSTVLLMVTVEEFFCQLCSNAILTRTMYRYSHLQFFLCVIPDTEHDDPASFCCPQMSNANSLSFFLSRSVQCLCLPLSGLHSILPVIF